MKVSHARRAIREGCSTAPEIAEFLESHDGPSDRSHVSRELNRLVEQGELERYRNQGPNGAHVYDIAEESDADMAEELLLEERTYEWQHWVPAPDQTSYVEVDNERQKIVADITERHQTGELPHFLLTGPPGTGKTSLARDIAADQRWPLFEVTLTPDTRRSDLVGKSKPHEGTMKWADAVVTKALLCSQERPTVLLLDEPNRARGRAHASLFPVLDHRCHVHIEDLSETVEGDPLNLIVISTANIGPEFDVYDLDPALKRRLGDEHPITWLGYERPERERLLLTQETPLSTDQAAAFVRAANAVRERATNQEARIRRGIATSELIRWAQSAVSYSRHSIENATAEAAKAAIVEKHYSDDIADRVLGLLSEALESAAVSDATEVVG